LWFRADLILSLGFKNPPYMKICINYNTTVFRTKNFDKGFMVA
jgi:hypothetical protein